MPDDFEYMDDVPDGSELVITATSESMGFGSEVTLLASQSEERVWSHESVVSGKVRATVRAPKTYAAKINVRVLDDSPVTIRAEVTPPDGDVPEAVEWTLEGPGAPASFVRVLLLWTA